MPHFISRHNRSFYHKVFSGFWAVIFVLWTMISLAGAQLGPDLPAPGQKVEMTSAFQPAELKGMVVHPENPLLFDFIVDRGQDKINNDQLKNEATKLIKYFLASVTIPDKDTWVNLSPYESDRITSDALSQTEMGRQMLEQDYILKRLSVTLTNPDNPSGQKFWEEVNARIHKQLGAVEVPLNIFDKVWIVPANATVVEKDAFVYISECKLKVMVDEDYLAMKKSNIHDPSSLENHSPVAEANHIATRVFKEMILPLLNKEINEGKNFASTRQIYQSLILADWYRKTHQVSLLGNIYVDKSKVAGIESEVKDFKQKVFDQHVQAVKKDVCAIPAGNGKNQMMCINFFGEEIMSTDYPQTKTDAVEVNRIASEIIQAGDQLALVSSSLLEALPVAAQAVSRDQWSESSKTKAVSKDIGAIDFNPVVSLLQIKRDSHGVPLPWPQQDLENINIKGLYPIIINVLPINAQTLPILSP